MAEIQTLLPNGMYRAKVAQRDFVLSLPYAAKGGDVIELQVLENNGHTVLALTRNTLAEDSAAPRLPNLTTTYLSQTGQLISDLLYSADQDGARHPPTLLAGRGPLFQLPPRQAGSLVPVLRQAITDSGLFYESHQARWAVGEIPSSHLLDEPQGQLSSPAAFRYAAAYPTHNPFTASAMETQPLSASQKNEEPTPASPVAEPLLLLVRQQLEALAARQFVWQGRAWPGQSVEWAIHDEEAPASADGQPGTSQWQTTLRMQLPGLGEVHAKLTLRGENNIDIHIVTDSQSTEKSLRFGSPQLSKQMEGAGLNLTMFGVTQHERIRTSA